jgi:hydroxymethylbilane synthase
MAGNVRLRLGTRASPLARWQADWVAARLHEMHVDVEMVLIATGGDVKSGPIGSIGGQGVFTKEIQRALLIGEVDLAVHSLKDLPTEPIDGLTLAAVPQRESPGDVLVLPLSLAKSQSEALPGSNALDQLPHGACVGTGSLRRRAQLLHARGDLHVLDIRGNVDTRLRKLDEGDYDAIVLAEAGLRRLGLSDRISQLIPQSLMLPAVGQGALGIEARDDDHRALDILAPLNDAATRSAVLAERAMLARLRGGCLAPVGAFGRVESGELKLDGVVLSGNGGTRVFATASGTPDDPQAIGVEVADKLLEQGAGELIVASRQSSEPPVV